MKGLPMGRAKATAVAGGSLVMTLALAASVAAKPLGSRLGPAGTGRWQAVSG
jgi:hypothetical protein